MYFESVLLFLKSFVAKRNRIYYLSFFMPSHARLDPDKNLSETKLLPVIRRNKFCVGECFRGLQKLM